MCGLVGVAGNIHAVDLEIFRDLLWIDALRGMDNTGVASSSYANPDEVRLRKVQGGPDQLFDSKKLSEVIYQGVSVLLGHNRSKTMGDASHKNAHPFEFEHIVGAHNGTLTWPSKNRFEPGQLRFNTDSEALYYNLNKNGLEDTMKKIDGAWSLTWYDKRDRSLNFLRNKERPLFYVTDEEKSTLYWASEPTMLYLVLNRHGIKLSGKCKSTPEDMHIRWVLNEKAGFVLDKPEHTERKMVPFVPPVSSYEIPKNHWNSKENKWESYVEKQARDARDRVFGESFPRRGCGDNVVPMKPSVVSPRSFQEAKDADDEKAKNKVVPVTQEELDDLMKKGKLRLDTVQTMGHGGRFYIGYDRQRYDVRQFEAVMSEGCATGCGVVPTFGEPVKFLKDGTFVCSECLLNNDHKHDVVGLIKQML